MFLIIRRCNSVNGMVHYSPYFLHFFSLEFSPLYPFPKHPTMTIMIADDGVDSDITV